MLPPNAMSPDSPPYFSVIVVCRNPGPRLEAALASVWAQPAVRVEVIVIDGASTDGTRAWLEQNRARIDTLVSELDTGVYAAMNRGLALARGEWLLFLGADDELAAPTVLGEVQARLRETAAGVAVGEIQYDDGRVYRLAESPRPIARNFVHHQGAFYRRSLFAENGHFDPALAVMADYDFNLRLWKNSVRIKPLPLRIARCGVGGLSDRGDWRGYREEIAVRHRYFAGWRCLGWDALSFVRYLRKKIVSGLRPSRPRIT